MVVPSPQPTMPSLAAMRTSTSVWWFIVATESLCGRMVGTSTSIVSTVRITSWEGIGVALCLEWNEW